MTAPIKGYEMSKSDKKSILKDVDKFNKMGSVMHSVGYKQEEIPSLLYNLTTHHDIETNYERAIFKDLDWNITIPEMSSEFRDTSTHNFSILKEQILMNQHNPLYNSRANLQTKPIEDDQNEIIRKELFFNLQNLDTLKKDLANDCAEVLQHINSQPNFNLIHEDIRIKSNNYPIHNLYAKEIIRLNTEKDIRNKDNQITILRKLENLKESNKLWYKLKDEEKEILNKMTLN
jgi:hypothetical protein